MLKFVVFDLDGTLGDTLPLCLAAFKKAVTPYMGYTPDDEEVTKAFGLNEEGMMKIFVGNRWQEALDEFYAIYTEMHPMCPSPFPGIAEILCSLKQQHLGLALITGKGKTCCDITLAQFGLADVFEFIAIGSPERNVKADALRRMLGQYQLSPDEIVYVGDTLSDVVACREAGVRCLSAAWAPGSLAAELEQANKGNVVYSVGELRSRLGL